MEQPRVPIRQASEPYRVWQHQLVGACASALDPRATKPIHVFREPPTRQLAIGKHKYLEHAEVKNLRRKLRPEWYRYANQGQQIGTEFDKPSSGFVADISRMLRLMICDAVRRELRQAKSIGRAPRTDYVRAIRKFRPFMRALRILPDEQGLKAKNNPSGSACTYSKKKRVTKAIQMHAAAGIDDYVMRDPQLYATRIRAYLDDKPAGEALTGFDLCYEYNEQHERSKKHYLDNQAFLTWRALGRAADVRSARDVDMWLRRAQEIEAHGNDGHRFLVSMGRASITPYGYSAGLDKLSDLVGKLISLSSGAERFLPGEQYQHYNHAALYHIGRVGAYLDGGPGSAIAAYRDTRYANLSPLNMFDFAIEDAATQRNLIGSAWMPMQKAKAIAETRSYDKFDIAFKSITQARRAIEELELDKDRDTYENTADAIDYALDATGSSFDQCRQIMCQIMGRLERSRQHSEANWLAAQMKRPA